MEAVLLIGVQGSGKSTFYRKRFFSSHVRISLDLMKTRHRERLFLHTCLSTGQPFVIDNTNPTISERQPYIVAAKAARFRVVGYYLQSKVQDCIQRNEQRAESERVPLPGLLGTHKKLELPSKNEGLDELFYVRLSDSNEFIVEEWSDEI